MPIKLEIIQETPDEVVNAILLFAGQFKAMGAVPVAAAANDAPKTYEDQGKFAERDGEAKPQKTRRKAPAAEAVIDQAPAQTDIEEVTGTPDDSFPMLTIEDARERMKAFAKDGHMDCVEAALAHFSVKKVSDVDPDAVGKPSRKFAAFVAKIEALVAAKPAVQE